jgi:hypothetical protein
VRREEHEHHRGGEERCAEILRGQCHRVTSASRGFASALKPSM